MFSFHNPMSGDESELSANKKKRNLTTPAPVVQPPVATTNPVLPPVRPVEVGQMMLTNEQPQVSYEPPTVVQENEFQQLQQSEAPVMPSPYERHVGQMQAEQAQVKKPGFWSRVGRGALMGMSGGNLLGGIGGALGGATNMNDKFVEDDKAAIARRYDPMLQSDLLSEKIRNTRADDQRSIDNNLFTRQNVLADNRRADEAGKRDTRRLTLAEQAADNEKWQLVGDDQRQGVINMRDPKAPMIPIQGLGPKRVPNLLTPGVAGEIAQSEEEGNAAPFDTNAAMDRHINELARSQFGKIYDRDPERAKAMVQRDPSLMNAVKTRVSGEQASYTQQGKSAASRAKAKGMRGVTNKGTNDNVGTSSDYESKLEKIRKARQ